MLADLALERRIDTDLEKLILVDASSTGDDLLDPVLAEIAQDGTFQNAQYWVEKTAARSEEILEQVLERLVAKDILTHHLGEFWSLSRAVIQLVRIPLQTV